MLNGVREESIEHFKRVYSCNFGFEAGFDFKPGLLEKTRPHISIIDWFGEQWLLVMAQNVVIDEQYFPSAIIDHLQRGNSVTVAMGQDDSVDEFRVACKVAQEYSEILQHFV